MTEQSSEKLISIGEASSIIGISPSRLYRWAKEGHIGHIQVAEHGRIMFFEKEIMAFLKEKYQPPRSAKMDNLQAQKIRK